MPTPTPAQALTWADTAWGGLKEGHATAVPQPVFGRIECDFVTEAAPAPPPEANGKGGKSGKGKQDGAKQQQGGKKQKQQQQPVAASAPQ